MPESSPAAWASATGAVAGLCSSPSAAAASSVAGGSIWSYEFAFLGSAPSPAASAAGASAAGASPVLADVEAAGSAVAAFSGFGASRTPSFDFFYVS